MIITTHTELSQVGINKLFQVKSKRIYQAIISGKPMYHSFSKDTLGCDFWTEALYKVVDSIENCHEACIAKRNVAHKCLWYKKVRYRVFL